MRTTISTITAAAGVAAALLVGTAGAASAAGQPLTELDAQLPVGALAQLYDIPLELWGLAASDTADSADVSDGDPIIDLPKPAEEQPAG
ncbi:hypothetical protein [Saccharopolyspora flava]|uniref:Secreted protein n=1 Tax=Saccharopolyspora flava TaxID=95161 RepID=A0A1I6QEQ9_9PSEU|nr:hypothetical protein [Saccharopolyspora flava]SFS50956.1 hypothetical protein SAMN05660874_01390 [Saccharopolyspora flava]